MATSATNNISLRGLDEDAVQLSRVEHGDNKIISAHRSSLWSKLIENFKDPIIRVLLVALAMNLVLTWRSGSLAENIGIIVAIFISTIVSTLSEYSSEKAFQRLRANASAGMCSVIRGGKLIQIHIDDVVVGDLVRLGAGEMICADGIVWSGKLLCDQSSLNGENVETAKYPSIVTPEEEKDLIAPNRVFRGSTVISGEACIVVTSVGHSTVYGSIASELSDSTSRSPLKERLSKLAGQISVIGYIAAFFVAVLYLFNELVVSADFEWQTILYRCSDIHYIFPVLLHTLTLAVTVVVVSVPEGLPMMITVVLSSNTRKMLRDAVLVKKLVGIETAGSMNILFCDKTGTLTMGEMRVNTVITPSGTLLKNERQLREYDGGKLLDILSACAYYNTDSTVVSGHAVGGNGTDRAILNYFASLQAPCCRVGFHTPFDSAKRYEAASLSGKLNCTIVKGAPEVLLPKVNKYLDKDSRTVAADSSKGAAFSSVWKPNAADGERVICICVTDRWADSLDQFEGLTLIGFICLKDKLRIDCRESVDKLKKAGISVVMMTGDSPDTAFAIACEAGIIQRSRRDSVLTGAELAKMSDTEIMDRISDIRVIARALPGDKLRLVKLSQRAGLVVGMTGDGVNDSPSLKAADVGFAMGNGTDVAKEASDIVLLDSKLKNVVSTVLYGRTIFKSIRKFIVFQLIMNLCAVGVSILGPYLGIDAPVTIIQMLWVNLIMDTLGGLAFAGEPALEYYMLEPPKKREEPILTTSMLWQIVITGGFTLALCIYFLCSMNMRARFEYTVGGGTEFLTAFFGLFIFCGIFNCFNVRTERFDPLSNIGGNKPFVAIMVLISAVQLLLIYFGGSLFRTAPLSVEALANIIFLACSVVAADIFRKIFFKLIK